MDWTDKAGKIPSRSPKRRSRIASLIGSDPSSPPPRPPDADASVKYRRESNNSLEMEARQRSEHEQILVRPTKVIWKILRARSWGGLHDSLSPGYECVTV